MKLQWLGVLVAILLAVLVTNQAVHARTSCKPGFVRFYRRCFKVDKARVSHSQAKELCAEAGGRLANFLVLAGSYRALGQITGIRGGQFFIGGVKSFANGIPNNRWDLYFVRRVVDEYKIINRVQLARALKRFRINPTTAELNENSELRGQCLVLDYARQNKPILVDCDAKMNFICQQDSNEDDDDDAVWTEWFNEHPVNARGEYESFARVVRAVAQGRLKGALCRRPVAMECRDVRTKAVYNRQNTHGFRLSRFCDRGEILCYHNLQRGRRCPDYEVRFKCAEPILDCQNQEVRDRCARFNRECHMGPTGAICVQKRPQKTGNEKIGVGTCTLNSKTYTLHQCVAWGDPHYITPDGSHFDMQGPCHYNLLTTCNNFKDTHDFPRLKVTVFNERRNPKDRVTRTKAFILEVNGIKYMFTRGGFYRQGVKRRPLCYKDDEISINVIPKGHYNDLIIKAGPCVIVTWNNIHTVRISTSSQAHARQVNLQNMKERYDACIYDHCLQAEFAFGRCKYLEGTVEEFLGDLNIDDAALDKAWRDYAVCADSDEEKCGGKPNMEFRQSMKPACQKTCAQLDNDVECKDFRTTSGCVCKEGFVLDGEMNCVEEEECSKSCNYLTDDGERITIQDGETEVLQHCTKFAKCEDGEVKITDTPPCSEFADCVEGGKKCECRQGFKGDGRTSQPRLLMCRSQSRSCAIPAGKLAVGVRLKFPARDGRNCAGKFRLSANKRILSVQPGCSAQFIVRCVDRKLELSSGL
ncbi:Fc fragment of IgG-binding protein [Elysia marginata]|uniref:Fc of IgG-binding protein n=1 Tax=Elysia marginata TaxID=1093978 RepID=A0AAV4EAL7_9GAST|nr:Fc fragment of IgG-binding protein [Elysia marginata]